MLNSIVCSEVKKYLFLQVPEKVIQSLSPSVDSTESTIKNLTDSIYDKKSNVDVIVENLNEVEEFQNDFDSYQGRQKFHWRALLSSLLTELSQAGHHQES